MSNRTRLAPSPTGFPHVGTMFQALFDYVIAKQNQGTFVVRIEDTDQTRQVEGAEDKIFEALEWFGFVPDESSNHPGKYGPYRQSERLEIYQKYARQLVDQDQAYYCFCQSQRLDQVRKQMQQQGKPPMYDRHCRNLDKAEAQKRSQTEPHVIRMKVPDQTQIVLADAIRGDISFDSAVVDDQVILKSDGFPTYHLAVVVDDHLMEITHVVRGEEWISSGPKHVLLYQYFGWPMPVWIHTPLLRNPDKSKLAKRHGHASVTWYQQQGYLKEAVINFLASRVWNHPEGKEVYSLEELIEHFDVRRMHIQGPIVDLKKLDWYNGQYIRSMDNGQLESRLKDFVSDKLDPVDLTALVPLVKDRLIKLSDIDDLTDFVYNYNLPESKLLIKRADSQTVISQLQETIDQLRGLSSWQVEPIEQVLRHLQQTNDWHLGQYFMLVRLAATGKTATPPLFESLVVLGQEKTLDRLNQCLELIKST